MLKQSVIDVLNQQLNYELHSSNIYLQMSNWCRTQGLLGAASFFKSHAEEEYQHFKRIWKHLEDNNVRPHVGVVPAVNIETKDLRSVLEQAYQHEQFVSSAINNCVKVAQEAQDYKTFNFLQWFVDEQVEEESLFSDILGKFDIAGNDGIAVYYVDRDIESIH
ncbi:hypothetical protein CJP74_01970 [Psittacicella melopsittaci]|uniref:Ferritin n=1 Tax=Psittacicella melopsittaci TaxID=2028576 RepID=A0A3A1YB90_9GAMM|nr:ferritin [Psittacicella melopsittaci]RIY33377.1 hypothetical protein CJP74_01970 [Psittacicella melopsittaci]